MLRDEGLAMRAVPDTGLRYFQRIPATIPIRLVVESEGFKMEHEASTIDLSLRGVKVSTAIALLPGETVGIIARGDSRHAISACVVWVERVETGPRCLSGLEFLETLPA
jgi:hypothetical protein